MDNHISWIAELRINAGRTDEFRTLTREMIETTKREPGALIYERFINGDTDDVYVLERYMDSASAMQHLLEFKDRYGERFSEMVSRERFTVFGNPTKELVELLKNFNAEFIQPFDGFSRF